MRMGIRVRKGMNKMEDDGMGYYLRVKVEGVEEDSTNRGYYYMMSDVFVKKT